MEFHTLLRTACFGCAISASASAQDPVVSMRFEWLSPTTITTTRSDGPTRWNLPINSTANSADVEVAVVLAGHCQGTEEACYGSERGERDSPPDPLGGTIWGCRDHLDNDDDGLIDRWDPECRGIQGWSLSAQFAPCFSIGEATTIRTAGDLEIRGGLRLAHGSYEKTEIVDPERNGGRHGVVSAVVVSFHIPMSAPFGVDHTVLRVSGEVSRPLVDAETPACALRIVSSEDFADGALAGSGARVQTAVMVDGETEPPRVETGSLEWESREDVFLRGDANTDGVVDISDALSALTQLFHGADTISCRRAADANADRSLDVSDPVELLNVLFLGKAQLDLPFPDCGTDPDAETPLDCQRTPPGCG